MNGLQLKRFPGPDGTMVAEFVPTPTHRTAEGIVCGGIVGTLLDCHAAAVASAALDIDFAAREALMTKTYTVNLRRATPVERVTAVARAVDVRPRSLTVDAELHHGDGCAPPSKASSSRRRGNRNPPRASHPRYDAHDGAHESI